MTTIALPKLIVIKSYGSSQVGHAHRTGEEGSVALGELDVLSTRVKIEVEPATTNARYVHLRFYYSNRYWARKATDGSGLVVAESKQPVEDTSDPSCTMFEAVGVKGVNGAFYLRHVQSGGRVVLDNFGGPGFLVDPNPVDGEGYHLTFVDWDTLVKLPGRVAFKGSNDSYLGGVWAFQQQYLQFAASDPNQRIATYRVEMRPDGYVLVYSDFFDRYWARHETYNWILASAHHTADDNTLFWPVKIDGNTIALRSKVNGNFCKIHASGEINRCLNAAIPTITNEARLRVEELVLERSIYDVTYRMEDARIFDETPFVAGTFQLTNESYEEASMDVSITYEDSKSYTFSRGFSVTAGVSTTISAGVPLIVGGEITVNFEISGNFQWDETTVTTTTVTASGSVPVPARSRASIEYVGTRGTCTIPYIYTQQDKSSIDGALLYAYPVDGSYTGVSSYNYNFTVKSVDQLL